MVASHFLRASGLSIGIIIFVGLVLGWTTRLGPQGVVQVPVSALLVFLLSRATRGYGGDRIVETAIGAGVALLAVLVGPSAPSNDAVVSGALGPLRRCGEILRSIAVDIGSQWSPEQAEAWCCGAVGLFDATAVARQKCAEQQLSARWNAWAYRRRPLLKRAEEALSAGQQIAEHIRSITRAVGDGSADAESLAPLGSTLVRTASATDAYADWVGSTDSLPDRRRLSEAIRSANDSLVRSSARAEQGWGRDPSRWLTVGTTWTLSRWILAEISRPLDSNQSETV
jgi:hypothetical protein